MSSDREEPPIRVLGLSHHAYNCLRRAGIDTVSRLAVLTDEKVLAIRDLGPQSFAEIKRKLQLYLARYPLPPEVLHRTDGRRPASPRPEGTALKALGLSVRPHNALMRSGIKTVDQLAAMSDEQISSVRNIGSKSLADIKNKLEAYLTKHSLPADPTPRVQKPQPPPPPRMVDRQILEVAQERDIPLEGIFIERLGLPWSVEGLLRRARIRSIGALTRVTREIWHSTPIIKQRLGDYLDWLIKQNEDVWANEKAGHGLNPLLRLRLRETTLEVLTTSWLSVLSDRQREIVRWRHGLAGESLTLEQIGERIGGVTRERVRQVLAKVMRSLSQPLGRRRMHLVRMLLIDLLDEAGGVMSERRIEAALRRELTIGDVDPIGVSGLVLDLHGDFKWLHKAKVWGLTWYPLAEVEAVQEQMTRVLEKAHAPLPANEVISRFKQTRFTRDRQDKLPEAFVNACLRAHPDLVCGDDNCYGLKRWERSRLDEIVQALRQMGEPAHYTVIAEKANAMLDPEMRTSARNIHEMLCRRKDLFVWMRVRGVFGLKEWGLEQPPSYEEALVRILESTGRPLTLEEILARFPEVRSYHNENSVSMTLMMNARFRAYPDGTYGLSSWRLADEHVEDTSAHERELKRKVAQLLGISSPQSEVTSTRLRPKRVKRRTRQTVSDVTHRQPRPERSQRRATQRVSIRDLVEEGIVEPGLQLRYINKGGAHTAEISSQGTILYQEKHYSSPSTAERAVIGYSTTRCWHNWEYRHPVTEAWGTLAMLQERAALMRERKRSNR